MGWGRTGLPPAEFEGFLQLLLRLLLADCRFLFLATQLRSFVASELSSGRQPGMATIDPCAIDLRIW